MHQVGLAQSHASVEEQRIVHIARRLGHGQGSRVGELIVAADYEGVKGVFRVDIGLFIVDVRRRLAGSAVLWMLFSGGVCLSRLFFCDKLHLVLLAGKFRNGYVNRSLKSGIQVSDHLFAHGNDDFDYMIFGAVHLQGKEPGLKRNVRKLMLFPDMLQDLTPVLFYQVHSYISSMPVKEQFIL